MAISAAMRTDIIELAVIANDAAPGQTLLAELVALADAGKSLTAIAEHLTARSAFTATYPTTQTANEFGVEWIANLLPEASAALQAECVVIVEAHINGGGSIASLLVSVQEFMSGASESDANLGTLIANFNHKVEVATYHTITKEAAAEWSIPSTVTSTESTVATGKAAVDTALTPAAATPAAVATFAVASDVSTVSEGGDVVFTLTTTNVAAGTEYSYVISGINSSDLSSGSLTGLAEVDSNGKATVSVGLKNDTTTEGAETMVMTVAGETASVSVTDSSTTAAAATAATATFSLASDVSTVSEGGDVVYTLTTTNVTAGTEYAYVISGINSSDLSSGSLTGLAEVDSDGKATVSVGLKNDTTTEGAETMVMTVAGETASVSVTDSSTTAAAATATTYTLSASAVAVDEGDSGQTNLVFNLSLDKAAVASTIVNYESLTTGTATTGVDFDSASGSVTFAVGQQNASVSVKVNGDTTFESAETVKATFSGSDLVASVTASGTITNDDTDPDTVAQAKTLTIGADTLTTGSGADTFNGSTASTLDTDDTIDGGAGTDTLSATIAATESIRPTISNVENIKLTATGALTVDARDISGVTTYTSESSTAAVTINYAAAVSNLTVNSSSGNAAATLHTFNMADAATAGTADAMTVTLDNIDADTVVTITDAGGTTNELETVTLNSIGLANTLDALNTVSVETTTLNVTGDQSLTVTNAIDSKIATIDASAHTGTATSITGTNTATTYTGGSGGDTFVAGTAADIISSGAGNDIITAGTGNDIVTLGAGNDSVASGAGTDSLTGGAGNDTFNMGTTDLTSLDTVAGGDGTDKIMHSAVIDVDFTNVTGVETLEMASTGTNTLGALAQAAGITKVDLATDAAYTVSASTYTVAMTIDATASSGNQETLTTGSGDDVFQFATTTGLQAADIIDAGTGTDTIQLVNAAAVTAVYDADVHEGIDKIVLTDANGTATSSGEAVTITISADSATAANTLIIDGSVVTDSLDDLTVTNNAASTLTSFTITGGAGDDILAGSNAADTITGGTGTNSLTGNSGNDIITGGSGVDTINDGAGNDIVDAAAGNDIITIGSGTDNITAGAGNDAISATTNLTSADTLAGGAGTDTLTINAATVDADFTNVTGVEKLTMNDTGTYTLGALAQAAGITTVTAGSNNVAYTLAASTYTVALTVDLKLQNTTSVVDTVTTGSGDDIVVVDSTTGLEDGDIFTLGTGTDTIQLDNSAAAVTVEYDADDHSGVESITVKDVDGAATSSAEAITVTISADSATAANTFIIDGSNITDTNDDLTVTNNAASTLTSYTITGGAGDDILAGSNAADTITGGTGTNSLTGNSGNDIITGGSGVDTINGGAGNDIVDAGAGNDIITIAAGTDNITAGAGNDSIAATTNLTSADTLAGGAGTDTLTLSAATVDADFTNVTGVEKLTVGTVGTFTLGALAQAAGVTTFTTIDGANTLAASTYTVGLTVDATASAGDTDTFTTGSGDDTFTFDGTTGLGAADIITAGTGSDTIKLDNSAAAVAGTVDLDTISGVSTFVTATDADGADANAQTMSLTFTGVTETTVQSITVDGSAVTDADDDLTVAAANVTVATTSFVITGGAGDDILGGGSGADTINGGSGVDTITGGAGADIIDGGAGNDIISTTGALLTGLDTIVGGAGTDVLSLSDASTVIDDDFSNITTLETVTNATAAALTITLGTAAAAAGVVTLNGNSDVDTITLGSGFTNNITITGNAGADIYVFSAYTGTATVATGAGAHGITLGTGTEKITGGAGVETVQVAATAHLASTDTLTGAGATDVINFSAAATVTDAQFTNVTTFETITAGNVILNLTGGAQLEEAGITTITLGNAANVINLSSVSSSTDMTVTGGTGADSIRGGAGDDILSGGNGADTYVFNATGALNGTDVITFVVGGDKFDFSNMGTFTFLATKVAYNAATDIVITNKIVMLADADLAASTNTITEIAADIQGAATAMELQSGGKAIVIAGYDGDALDGAIIYLVDDSLGDTTGTIEADDIVKIATLATFDVDTFTGYNFV